MKLYHITPRRNIISIFYYGIVMGKGKGLARTHISDRIYLTDNVDKILTSQCGQKWIDRNDPVILEIDCSNFDIETTCGTINEFYVKNNIPVSCILNIVEI